MPYLGQKKGRIAAAEKKRKPLEYGGKDDFQLVQALNQLKGLPVQISKIKPEIRSESDKDDKADPAAGAIIRKDEPGNDKTDGKKGDKK